MILETSNTDVDKALVKAATQNKLGYDAIRTALLAMHEDRDRYPGKGKGKYNAQWTEDYTSIYGIPEDPEFEYEQYQAETWGNDPGWQSESTWQQNFYQQPADEWEQEPLEDDPEVPGGETSDQDPEKMAMLSQLQEEQEGLQAMMMENQRNLQQARQAVAQARRDRGWQSSTQSSKGFKPTSTFMNKGQGKNKGKGKPKGSSGSPASPLMWTSKGFPKGKNKSFGKNHSGKNNWFAEGFESGMLSLEPGDDFQIFVNEVQESGKHATFSVSPGCRLIK